MRTRAGTITAAAAIGAALMGATAAGGQGRGPATVGATVTIWADANFRGQSVTLRGATPDLRQYGLNNAVSSLRMAPGQAWEVCEQPNFGGRCQVVSGEIRDLGKTTSWNDKISSLRPVQRSVSGGSVVGPAVPGYAVTLYSQPGFRGQSREFRGSVSDIRQANFNDRAQSARVRGNWQFCQDVNFGKCRAISGDVPNLAATGLAGSVSSLRPAGGAVVGPGPGRQLLLYSQPNYGGSAYPVTGPMAQTGTVVTRSARAQGTWQVCDGRQFTGVCQVISGNVADVRSLGLARIQSARPQ